MQAEHRSIVGNILYFVKKASPVYANACCDLSQHLENPKTISRQQWHIYWGTYVQANQIEN
jgi:hypothetical protein